MENDFAEPKETQYRELLEWVQLKEERGVELLVFDQPVRSVAEAMGASGLTRGDFIKSICMKHKKEDLYIIAIILAGSKVDKKKLKEGVGSKKWTMATPAQIHEIIGFPAGGVPPVCLPKDISVYVDPRVLSKDVVVGGGGTQSSLLKLPTSLIVESGAEEKIISIG